ncbi:MAG: MlaD family protein [Gammaproteobacteria bacterium]|nr:MAG: MlaD family protein [Gammaproteobacteria bacterium]
MSKRANTTVIGAFVIGAIALVLGAVMMFGTGQFFNERVVVVTVFQGSVTGLQVGSPVEFRGVPVGTVTSIKALYDPEKTSFKIPVYMSLNRDSVTDIRSDERARSPEDEVKKMIEAGLRARLDIRSLITGTKFVALDFRPDTTAILAGIEGDVPEIPSIASPLDKVTSLFDKLDVDALAGKAVLTMDGISALVNSPILASTIENLDNTARNANELVLQLRADTRKLSQTAVATLEQTRQTVAAAETALAATLSDVSRLSNSTDERLARVAERLDAALSAVQTLATNLDQKTQPLADAAKATMDQATSTLRAAENLIGEDSNTRYNLDTTLEELAAAARSVRLMANYLEQNPDALLKGRGQ